MNLHIDPKVDIVFRTIFANPDHPDITINLVNSLLLACRRQPIHKITNFNPLDQRGYAPDRDIILDVLAQDQSGQSVQIEIQHRMMANLGQRALDNWARTYTRQVRQNRDYLMHRPVISIWLLAPELLSISDPALRVFSIRDEQLDTPLNDDLTIAFLNLPAWERLRTSDGQTIFETGADVWMYFLQHGTELDPANLPPAFDTAIVKEALAIMTSISHEKLEHYWYEQRLELEWYKNAYSREAGQAREAARTAGFAAGAALARQDMARRLLAMDIDCAVVSEITGLYGAELSTVSS